MRVYDEKINIFATPQLLLRYYRYYAVDVNENWESTFNYKCD